MNRGGPPRQQVLQGRWWWWSLTHTSSSTAWHRASCARVSSGDGEQPGAASPKPVEQIMPPLEPIPMHEYTPSHPPLNKRARELICGMCSDPATKL